MCDYNTMLLLIKDTDLTEDEHYAICTIMEEQPREINNKDIKYKYFYKIKDDIVSVRSISEYSLNIKNKK